MSRLPRRLRLFWAAYMLVLLGLIAIAAGPGVEGSLFPLRTDQRIEQVQRFPGVFRFVWVSTKRRTASFVDLDVALNSHDDRFVETLHRDMSLPGEPPCTRMVPWSHAGIVPPGPHRQPFCVEIPRTISAAEPLTLRAVGRYLGWLGPLWQVRVVMPPVEVPGLL